MFHEINTQRDLLHFHFNFATSLRLSQPCLVRNVRDAFCYMDHSCRRVKGSVGVAPDAWKQQAVPLPGKIR